MARFMPTVLLAALLLLAASASAQRGPSTPRDTGNGKVPPPSSDGPANAPLRTDGATPRPGTGVPDKQSIAGVPDSEGSCHWDFKEYIAHVWIDTITLYKDHDSGTVTLHIRGEAPDCNDPQYPVFQGSAMVELDYPGGYFKTDQTRFADMRHDGGLSSFNFDWQVAFTGHYDYNPNVNCGQGMIWVYDDHCSR